MADVSVCLSIAGSDSGGGAGIQADNQCFNYFDCHAVNVLTAITVQDHEHLCSVDTVSIDTLEAQLTLVLERYNPAAIKTGILCNHKIIKSVTKILKHYNIPLVVDPVMVSTSGKCLLDAPAIEQLVDHLIPLATLITPNLPEMSKLCSIQSNRSEDFFDICKILFPDTSVLLKGGHAELNTACDYLIEKGEITAFRSPLVSCSKSVTHGTGCRLSAAITANIALGFSMKQSILRAKAFLYQSLVNQANLKSGTSIPREPESLNIDCIETFSYEEE